MDLVADIFLAAGALGAGLYCFVLSRKLSKFTNLENGVGGAVAVLSTQVEDLQKALEDAQKSAGHSNDSLSSLTERAEDAAKRLELMVAAMHDVPAKPKEEVPELPVNPVFSRRNGEAR